MAILLAAGGSRRFGAENKLLHLVNGKTMLETAIDALLSTEVFSEIIVVSSYQRDIITDIAQKKNVSVAYSDNWEMGIAESLKTGVLAATDADVVLFMPSDMPYLSADTIAAVALAVDENNAVACTKSGDYLGVPTAFYLNKYRDQLLGLTHDCGAKHILKSCVNPVMIAANAEDLIDIDCKI
ncbi:MAG: nucleotidyltransferase family protein [Negativicutes bacterium]